VLRDRYRVVEFINEGIADVYAAANLVIGRAGAGTVCELAFLGKPSILIPLPGTWGDEQRKNARVLADAGAAVVLEQDEATPDALRSAILELVGDAQRMRTMGQAARSVGHDDAAARLTDELLALAGRA
jgi:UDP-N-acetylglucosamine--N-acetylmuramyl-(pentapeptide) pyrophosphoryl-undecaprenol N-acetylglucosamine transferase